MTPQQRMQDKLQSIGIPADEIKVYGSQVMIETRGMESANKWKSVLARFVSGDIRVVETMRENKVNKNTVLNPSSHKAYLVAASI